jgi:hypothetical protein
MPRYFFDVYEGGRVIPHDGGLELAEEAVEREACAAATEIASDLLTCGRTTSVTVRVTDDKGQHVLDVVVTLEVERPKPLRRRAF